MYYFKNGILYKNEEPVLGIGVSYYASFFPTKVPVLNVDERKNEMIKDFAKMAEVGVNIIRTAALGNVSKEGDEVKYHGDFIDNMMLEAQKLDISMMVRLQGYTTNLSGNKNFKAVRHDGQEVEDNRWNSFIHHSLYHKGILKDNKDLTQAISKHFSKFENFVSFHIYNEPHYPGGGIYDYHPDTINAYRKWLVEKNIMTEDIAREYEPPKRRPDNGEDINEWINWRLFSYESLSNFLAETHDAAKAVVPQTEGVTSAVTTEFDMANATSGVDQFAFAKSMDIMGITMYPKCCGVNYFASCLRLDGTESAAKIHDKHCWLIEYDAKTNITPRHFNQETYMAIGAGFKGIMYYQWRGDFPFGNGPEENAFGLLNYDGSESKSYKQNMKMIKLLSKYGQYFVKAERVRSEAAILYSHHAYLYDDALSQRDGHICLNSYCESILRTYREACENHIPMDIIDIDSLEKLNIKTLFIPHYIWGLSDTEQKKVHEFAKKGGSVFLAWGMGYDEIQRQDKGMLDENYTGKRLFCDTLDIAGIKPLIDIKGSRHLMAKTIKGEDYYVVCLNNIDTLERDIKNASINFDFNIKSALFITPDEEFELDIKENCVKLPIIKDGAFVLVNI